MKHNRTLSFRQNRRDGLQVDLRLAAPRHAMKKNRPTSLGANRFERGGLLLIERKGFRGQDASSGHWISPLGLCLNRDKSLRPKAAQ